MTSRVFYLGIFKWWIRRSLCAGSAGQTVKPPGTATVQIHSNFVQLTGSIHEACNRAGKSRLLLRDSVKLRFTNLCERRCMAASRSMKNSASCRGRRCGASWQARTPTIEEVTCPWPMLFGYFGPFPSGYFGLLRGALQHDPNHLSGWILGTFVLLQIAGAVFIVWRPAGARWSAAAIAVFTSAYALFAAFVAAMSFSDDWL